MFQVQFMKRIVVCVLSTSMVGSAGLSGSLDMNVIVMPEQDVVPENQIAKKSIM